MSKRWKLWVDTGGTFTDCIAYTPEGEVKRLKVLSSGVIRARVVAVDNSTISLDTEFPTLSDIYKNFTCRILGDHKLELKVNRADILRKTIEVNERVRKEAVGKFLELTTNEEVPVFAARLITETSLLEKLPKLELKLGSTRGTNALLERKGAKTAFITTKGFKDLLLIRDQQRPDLFTVRVVKPEPLYDTVIEADERVESDGKVLKRLDSKDCEKLVSVLKKKRIQSVAIALINSYKNPTHERLLKKVLAKNGLKFVSISSELSSLIRILPRAETTVANAYLHPVIQNYLSNIREGAGIKQFKVMSSAGGLFESGTFEPKDSLLSGPAGGVIGAVQVALKSDHEKIITFDMGGTSTDVSLSNGRPEYRFESTVGNLKILSPSIAIETIASGGGSICDFDGHRFLVGPHSAGSNPGPACYGAGGPLTITDVNLLLGRLEEEKFAIPVQKKMATKALDNLLAKVQRITRKKYDRETILLAFVSIANEKMAEAIRRVSIQRGYDPTDYSLLSFGGAGGQHACGLAAILGIKSVVVPYEAGLLSAYGIGNAKIEVITERQVLANAAEFLSRYDSIYESLANEGTRKLVSEGHRKESVRISEKLVFARLTGQETSIEIRTTKKQDVVTNFKEAYRSVYGYWMEGRDIEIESVRVRLEIKENNVRTRRKSSKQYIPKPLKSQRVFVTDRWETANIFEWENLNAGASINGPAIIVSKNSTQFIEPGWGFSLDGNNNAIVSKHGKTATLAKVNSEEAQLELFTNRFTAIAQNMGAMLQRTAFSVNVKERLDFSCALLDKSGNLIVNAPHIPVHLGSLGVCVRAIQKSIKMQDGDVVITNHPAYGGSHLPDITLVKPVYYKKELIGYVANRAHHAEIGGIQPGSTPATATYLQQEGVIIAPTYLMRNGRPQWDAIEHALLSAKFPTRNVSENISDLRAALAALILGSSELKAMCDQYSKHDVVHYMQRISDHAASLMRAKISEYSGRTFSALEKLDDGSKLQVRLKFQKARLIIDFTGSALTHPGNLNATEAIVRSVIVYVLRLLIDKPAPLNEGLMKDVEVILPHGILNPKFDTDASSPAVVGGNTEISQRLTDTLIKALGLAACSQGTMNNFLFGNNTFGYYETIGGGTGAGKNFDGADAVHQHMTNTRITDVEVFEWRYPARVDRFEIRKGSGGKGHNKGGNGMIREFCFKAKLDVNILSQHRIVPPFGLEGGLPGKVGKQELLRSNNKRIVLKGIDTITVDKGDRLVIETPGGGGWGHLKR